MPISLGVYRRAGCDLYGGNAGVCCRGPLQMGVRLPAGCCMPTLLEFCISSTNGASRERRVVYHITRTVLDNRLLQQLRCWARNLASGCRKFTAVPFLHLARHSGSYTRRHFRKLRAGYFRPIWHRPISSPHMHAIDCRHLVRLVSLGTTPAAAANATAVRRL